MLWEQLSFCLFSCGFVTLSVIKTLDREKHAAEDHGGSSSPNKKTRQKSSDKKAEVLGSNKVEDNGGGVTEILNTTKSTFDGCVFVDSSCEDLRNSNGEKKVSGVSSNEMTNNRRLTEE